MLKRVVKLSISFVVLAIDQFRKVLLAALGKKRPGTCMVLYYHVVKPEEWERFARQMDILLAVARPISIENPPELEPGVHYAAVTFDDGFRETIEIVLPELKKKNIPVTVFVPTGCLGSEPPWISDRSSHHYGGAILAEDEIRKIDAGPLVSFGSHCVTHRPLPTLSDVEARDEIFRSKSDLEATLDQQVGMLSLPHGAFGQRHVDWAKQAGYSRAFSITPVLAFSDRDEFVIGRVRVDPTDWSAEFRLKLLGAYRWLSALQHRGGWNN
jgi:peptidoglycan/xylan/chitin deacetylase (PgdA/CDA1 family)